MLFKRRKELQLLDVDFELEEDAEYARLDQVDERISTLMAEIGAFKGSNVPPDPERVYVCPGKMWRYYCLGFIFSVPNYCFWVSIHYGFCRPLQRSTCEASMRKTILYYFSDSIPEEIKRKVEEMVNVLGEHPNYSDILHFVKAYNNTPRGRPTREEVNAGKDKFPFCVWNKNKRIHCWILLFPAFSCHLQHVRHFAHSFENKVIVNIPVDELVLCQNLGLTYHAFSKKVKSSFQVKHHVIFSINFYNSQPKTTFWRSAFPPRCGEGAFRSWTSKTSFGTLEMEEASRTLRTKMKCCARSWLSTMS